MLLGDEDRIDTVEPCAQAMQVALHPAQIGADIAQQRKRLLPRWHGHRHALMRGLWLMPLPALWLRGHASDLGTQPVLTGLGSGKPLLRNGRIEHGHILR